jgi:hypothetical protein
MKKMATIEFIQKAKNVHGDRYDYSKSNYVNTRIAVDICCHEHGVFQQTPSNHLLGQNCPICMKRGKSNNERFIVSAKEVHGNKYDYSKVIYVGNKTKVEIICKEHGIFEQTPTSHLFGNGCPKCNGGIISDCCEFIDKAKEIHGDKYDYSLVEYVNSQTKIKIICYEHGIFKMKPNNHLSGQCCPQCRNKSFGEKYINDWLIKHSIEFERQKCFDNCKNIKQLKFDFWIPNKNILIEYDGKQHYEPIKYMGGENGFKSVRINDKIKTEYASNNNFILLRIPYIERKNLFIILKNNIIINN